MAILDISYLTQIADFLVTYGPWALVIFAGLYILKIQRDHKKERIAWGRERIAERSDTIARYQEYHEEIVRLVEDASKSKTTMASKMLTVNNEVRTLRRALEQFFSLITEGIVKVTEIGVPEDIEETLSDFMPDTCIKFTLSKKHKDKEN